MSSQAYKYTEVHWSKTQADISRLLSKYKITDTRFTNMDSQCKVAIEFNYKTRIEEKEVVVGIKIEVPLRNIYNMEQSKNQCFRALYYYLKTKFEALDFKLVEFMEEFLPHIHIVDNNGRGTTIYKQLEKKLKEGYLTGNQAGVMLLELKS